jgi:hypothetical protein
LADLVSLAQALVQALVQGYYSRALPLLVDLVSKAQELV